MKSHPITRTFISLVVFTLGLIPKTSWAQIVPDTSLPTNSIVTPNANVFTLDGGTQTGGNLFHSFQEFSVPTGSEAFFNNSLAVQNIFTRVTGGKLSNIDGLLRANGGANLFVVNPSGIVLGPNARLDIGGSFFGSTADRIQFADGVEFSATEPTQTALLSINVPIGLQFGQNPGGITVEGSGHQTLVTSFLPLDRTQNPIGLQVSVGNTLALLGGEVNFAGGVAAVAGGGHLEVGSVSEGAVKLNPTAPGWRGDYSAVSQFNDIHLTRESLLDASGVEGSIQVQGRNITISEGSVIALQSIGTQRSEGITLGAIESVRIVGNTPDGIQGSQIEIDSLGAGYPGDIRITAAQLYLGDGSQIRSQVFTPAPGGNIIVKVTGLTELESVAPAAPATVSAISTATLNSGNAGEVNISTGNLRLVNGAIIFTPSTGSGQAGRVRIEAEGSIEIVGNTTNSFTTSALGSSAFRSGNASDVSIETSRLVIRDGGFVGSNTFATGSAGSAIVNASESVELRGKSASSLVASSIGSGADIVNPIFKAAFGLPPIPSGDAGSLTINTPSLSIANGGAVSVQNAGLGKAGDIEINADSMILDARGGIAASTASGNGGNIRLNVRDRLVMRHHSRISATAAGTGDGGNIELNAPVLVGLDNSDIIANALVGAGGNIQIDTQGIFGLENRDRLTPQSDITASSQFGVDGVVIITNPSVDPTSSLVNLSQEVVDPGEQVVAGCQWTADSQFITTGRGGVPTHPDRPLSSHRPWSDVRDLWAYRAEVVEAASAAPQAPPRWVEATEWVLREDGTVELIATASHSLSGHFAPANCDPP